MYVVFRAEQPISHSKADTLNQGNYTTFRRLPLLLDNGIIEVPTISGNAIGGAMRRQAFRELYEIAEFSYNDEFKSSFSNEKKAKTAWDRLYAALYIGGAIEKPSPTINTELLRNIRADFPALSLLGSALYTVTLSGVIMKGFAIPFCAETVNAKFWHSPHPVEYIPPFAELLTDMSFSRHIDTDLNSKNSGVKPMLYEIETINVGTYFEFNIDFSVIAKPIEKSAAAHIINNLTHLGGKISSGFGKISIISKLNDSGEYEEYLSQIKDNPYEFRKKLIELAKTLG